MKDEALLRYSRQIMVRGFDLEGQERLLNSRLLIIGLGGLGSPASLYLAAAGVGTLLLADDDVVDMTNLQRQILHRTKDIGRPKTDSAREQINALNDEVNVITLNERLTEERLTELVATVDVVLDGSDNFSTRFAVNAACVSASKPLVSAAVIGMDGQIGVFRPDLGGPCYRCVFADTGEEAQSCSETGVLGPLTGVMGSLQAVEAVKVLSGLGEPLNSRLLVVDALTQTWRRMNLQRDPSCPVCQCER